MPEEHDAMRPREKARSVNHVGATVEHRPDHGSIVPRVIFEIGILHEEIRMLRRRKSKPQRGAFATIHAVKKTSNLRMAVLAQELRGAVGRSVIDDNDLGSEA